MTSGAVRATPAMRRAMLGVVAATILAVIAAAILFAPERRERRQARRAIAARTVVPPAAIPPIEPIAFVDVTPETAREINAAVPFATGPNPAARPFRLIEPALDRARAQDCLAAAMLYEAGSADPEGQRAVAQVVINRLRHPAFPKTICGVVFQGQERATGCQFTFTCDGAMARRPNEAGWQAAHERAGAMLDGGVHAPVGHSTHYHTDWVVPYWSSSLDKVTAVRTHLFFRWTGWWGTPGAFRGRHMGGEPAIARLAALGIAASHRPDGGALAIDPSNPAVVAAEDVTPVAEDGAGTFVLLLDRQVASPDYPAVAAAACGDRAFCKVFGWTERARVPAALPIAEEAFRTMAFSYLRDRARGFDKSLWNCDRHVRLDPRECMKQRVVVPVAGADGFRLETLPRRPVADARAGPRDAVPGPLSGVRRAEPGEAVTGR